MILAWVRAFKLCFAVANHDEIVAKGLDNDGCKISWQSL